MSTCVRPGCRKNATYAVTLERLQHPNAVLHQWLLCIDHRDEMQFEQNARKTAAEAKPAVTRTRRRTSSSHTIEGPTSIEKEQAHLDREDQELRDRAAAEQEPVAQFATSNEEAKDATPERTMLGGLAKRGRPVASPAPG